MVLPASPPDSEELAREIARYGTRTVAVEPGGAEPIPLSERHGKPIQLLWTWTSPNLEFATVFVGFIGLAFFGLNAWQAALAIIVGNGLAAASHYSLSRMGPRFGVPQMVLSRLPFGFYGNAIPATIGSLIAGIGWFAVNSVSGALALSALTTWSDEVCLIIIAVVQVVVAFLGHNLVQAFERYAFPLLAIVWLLAAIWTFTNADFSAPGGGGGIGGFTLTAAACFGYAAGWNPYASDYTRYLAPGASEHRAGLFAALGLFASTTVLELVGVASATVLAGAKGNPVGNFTDALPTALGKVTLLCIALGSCAANILNIYSGALSFLAIGVRIAGQHARALVAALFGVVGTAVAWGGLSDAGSKYENFLLVVAYWLGPWLGVVFADKLVFRSRRDEAGLIRDRSYQNWAGLIALAVGVPLSIVLFSNQTRFMGIVVKHHPAFGDITFAVGALVSGLVYALLVSTVLKPRSKAWPG